jgi:uncharacterized SAM-binding protein YcdF (DUF218 family)
MHRKASVAAARTPLARTRVTAARWLVRLAGVLAIAAVLTAAYSPLPTWLYARLAVPAHLGRADAIVVLGSAVNPDGSLKEGSLRRTVHALRLFRAQLAPILIFSGHDDDNAGRMRLARELGFTSPAIVAASGANTTREEAAAIKALFTRYGVRRVLLVTGSQHLRRALPLFQAAGFEVLPAPVDEVSAFTNAPEERLEMAWIVLGEALARIYYRVAGYL